MSSVFRLPVATFHKRTIWSEPALASVLPSGLNDTPKNPSTSAVNNLSSWSVSVSYNHIPMSPATASIEPSGEYAIRVILPFPRRALAPSGRLNCVCAAYCAKHGRILRLETISRVKIKNSLIFIFMNLCLLWWLSVSSTVFLRKTFQLSERNFRIIKNLL